MNENWRPIPGYEGVYEVSDLGRVRSLDRIDARGRRICGRALRPGITRSGHLQVNLCLDGKRRWTYVHRLVLMTFVGPAPEGMEGCHGNGRPADNRLANLRWASQSENNRDRVRHGTHHEARKTHCPQGHAYDSFNTYIDARGRRCRICKRENDRVRSARKRARVHLTREEAIA